MHHRRPILVGLLLVTFVVGGVVGPVAHHLQHGAAELSDGAATACHAPGVHNADGPVWTETSTPLVGPECDLCARRLLLVPPTPTPATEPRGAVTPAVAEPSPAVAAGTASGQFIRGPPSLLEARPA